MPRYLFPNFDGVRIEDPVGVDCKNLQTARMLAHKIAQQIAIEVGPKPSLKVFVVDENGAELFAIDVQGSDIWSGTT